MTTKVVSRFGGEDSGDTRRGLVDEAKPFLGEITSFCHQNIYIF